MSAAGSSRDYVLTHSDPERRRLALQASIINGYTTRFLRDAGIADGMHVLDFGCGVGDVSLLAGRLVGSRGSVTGVDLDPEAVAIAADRAREEGLDHLRFVQADLNAFDPETKYDAVIGRHVLIHTPDPVSLLRRAREFAHPGGILAFQEYDLSFTGPPRFDDMPVWTTCVKAIPVLFERAGLPVRAGTLLYSWFLEAGLPVPECRLEYLVEGGADSLYYQWLTETMRSLLPKMTALGVLEPGAIDIDGLPDALRRESVAARRPLIVGPMGAAFARTPRV